MNLVAAVSTIEKREVSQEYAQKFALEQFGILTAFLKEVNTNEIIKDKLIITLVNGVYLINGKQYRECDQKEKQFFDNFILSQRELIDKILYIPAEDVEILK